MKLWDLLLTGGIVVIAVWYLYRKLVVSKGCSCGSSCSKTKSGNCTVPFTGDDHNNCDYKDGK